MSKTNNFKSILELMTHFSDEKTCLGYLAEMRWNGKPKCPHCKCEKIYSFSDSKRYKCAKCRKQFTARVKTIFEDSKIPLQKWFVAIYLATSHKKGISSMQLSRDIDVTQKTSWFMLHRIREMIKNSSPELLDGEIEADETFIGGKNSNKHKEQRKILNEKGTGYVNMAPVFTILKRSPRMIVSTVVEEAKGEILKPIIRKSIKAGSTLITDGFGGYHGLNKDYQHEIINHAQDEFVRGNFHTNTVEGFFSLLKRGITGIYHFVSPKHLQRYCDEFSFRYNTREMSESGRFNLALAQCDSRLTYERLIKK
ncbi:MAG: hypothetical protein COC01_06420 [Bacteroidetes bacterium]|nr:MAG: hypothetical protein COC01_06420 [Bacteroidota bacterium]